MILLNSQSQIERDLEIFTTAGGAQIFRIPMEVFPGFQALAYLVLAGDYRVLIDTGSGFGASDEHLERGFKQAREHLGQEISPETLTHILITHGHIDHFGGLSYLVSRTKAVIGIHELDRRNLANYEERLAVVSRRLDAYLMEAGVSPPERVEMLAMYNLPKALFSSVRVDFTYEEIGMRLGPFAIFHVPGHCPGHVVFRLHDVLFSGDHVLAEISPHQAPERLTLNTGLGHYLQSLDEVLAWAGDVCLTLGGHRNPILDLGVRIAEIKEEHKGRLAQVLAYLEEPHSIHELSDYLFGEVQGYHILLAVEEAGAHVEYLYQRGLLGINNLDALEPGHVPAPIFYYRL
jgi:glyoxylase-like metal-dependent hydrolase (beta-lactamase superfamily II)